jgi:hypothetical protein
MIANRAARELSHADRGPAPPAKPALGNMMLEEAAAINGNKDRA